MNAKEAREAALRNGVTFAEAELAPIRLAIDQAVKEGKLGIYLQDRSLSRLAIDKLISEGYTAKNHDDQRDGCSIEVSW